MPSDMKERIAREFAQLARTKSVDKITVKDIVEACHITRQTFYYHFQDLIDVIDWSFHRIAEELVERSLKLDSRQQVMELFLSEAVHADGMIRRLLSSQLREQTERLMVESIRICFQEMVDRKALFQDVSRSDVQVALDFYTFATVGILLEYCSRPNLDVKHLAGQLVSLMDGSFQKRSRED
ncbi:MAG TPA: TetR family transcriptional regulator [Candidatus Eisenbergiella intestinipullorum]|nr:TetR family transcriptional regulator [Candidatus Eisenbergiella intestinipullorum]